MELELVAESQLFCSVGESLQQILQPLHLHLVPRKETTCIPPRKICGTFYG